MTAIIQSMKTEQQLWQRFPYIIDYCLFALLALTLFTTASARA